MTDEPTDVVPSDRRALLRTVGDPHDLRVVLGGARHDPDPILMSLPQAHAHEVTM